MTEAGTEQAATSASTLTPTEKAVAAKADSQRIAELEATVNRLLKQVQDAGIAPTKPEDKDRVHTAKACAERIFERLTKGGGNPVRADGVCSGAGMADVEMLRLFSWLRVTKVDLGLDEAESQIGLARSAEAGLPKAILLRTHTYNIYRMLMPYYRVDKASRDSKGRRRQTEEGEVIIDRNRPAFEIIGNEGAIGVDLQNDWPADGTNEALVERAWNALLFPHLVFWPHRPPTTDKNGVIQYTNDALRQWRKTKIDEKTMGSQRRTDSVKLVKAYWGKLKEDAKDAATSDWAKNILYKVGTDGTEL